MAVFLKTWVHGSLILNSPKPMKNIYRSKGQLREHYEIEKELAGRLRNAAKQERCHLYASLYNELFQRVLHHPQLTQTISPQRTQAAAAAQINILKQFLGKDIKFLEVGAGDCALSLEVAKFVKEVYAVDVFAEIANDLTPPPNFRFILSDGCSIRVPLETVNLAYSHQLMEHLHPEDAFTHLQNIYNALLPGGVYVCITPNRLSGPHDISKHFDTVASGFHLKEYTISELRNLFKKAGFSKVRVRVGARGIYMSIPALPLVLLEKLLWAFPYAMRKSIAIGLPFRLLFDIQLVGIK